MQEDIQNIKPDTATTDIAAPSATLTLNADDYRDELKELELTGKQETALLEALWHIMGSFVDLGFGVDSVSPLFPEIFTQSIEQGAENNGQDSDKLPDSRKECINRKTSEDITDGVSEDREV